VISVRGMQRHLGVLEDAGFVRIDKVFEGKRPRTWVAATPKGRRAFKAEVETLQALIDHARSG
jgi:DNA-binding PadR family transcriptional regulator